MINLTIDDKAIEAHPGETVLQAALRSGVDIPHFCYHPCLSLAGNCRVCLVKVDGRPKLMPSCNLTVAPDMRIESETEEVLAARQAVLQFITLNHPADCGICDKAGECRVQDYHVKYGEGEGIASEQKARKPKLKPLGERLLLDNERCILCSRCVRFTREVSRSNMLGIVERGSHARVTALETREFQDPYSDNVIGICPSGALSSRDFLYKSRVWYLEPVRSVCSGCARCCSIQAWRRKKNWHVRSLSPELNRTIYRISPLENPEINGSWICNKGFDLPKIMARERALAPLIRGVEATAEQALEKALQLLRGASRPAVVLSSHASNEELDAFRDTLALQVTVYTRDDVAVQADEVLEDDFLIRADKNPNSHGVHQRFERHPFDPAAGHDVVVIWGEVDDYTPFAGCHLIQLTPFTPTAQGVVDVLIPIAPLFERSGSFTNFEGKTNRFKAVFDRPPLVQDVAEVVRRLAS
ncbi:2Fe-2S iron-sulfur cluster-binding protein [Geomonas sp.]|uniref:2Fe-2S iron-sulfur cluster-binding protein n=1 Tax=Geomonas sp. TaxID=2651584 RepID=UPI002B49A94A|nr:2Fe-2S iron-sulfur cluster-binding protein [Geomonas sp.]HJV35098.1 2Fe-2S iron-sulfur cluster-binding protein [Geomonas sp.]